MPIYEYYCTRCSHKEDVLQKFGEPAIVKCPECQKKTLKKKISAPGFQLKGTGWYETDFKDKGKPPQDEKTPKDGESKSDKPEKSDKSGNDGGDSTPAKKSSKESSKESSTESKGAKSDSGKKNQESKSAD